MNSNMYNKTFRHFVFFIVILITLSAFPFASFAEGETTEPLGKGFAATMVSVDYTLKENESPSSIVLYQETEGKPIHLIPRSWYADGKVYGKVQQSGTFAVMSIPSTLFSDTTGKWMDDAVQYLAYRDAVNGVTAPTMTGGIMTAKFGPDASVTRAEFVTMLMRMLDTDITFKQSTPFNDQLEFPSWAAPSISQALGLGIAFGDSKGNFNPNATISRQDMFVMTARAMEKFAMLPEVMTMQFIVFSDGDKISQYAINPIQTLAKLNLASGNAGAIRPDDDSSRAEVAQFLYNILKFDTQ